VQGSRRHGTPKRSRWHREHPRCHRRELRIAPATSSRSRSPSRAGADASQRECEHVEAPGVRKASVIEAAMADQRGRLSLEGPLLARGWTRYGRCADVCAARSWHASHASGQPCGACVFDRSEIRDARSSVDSRRSPHGTFPLSASRRRARPFITAASRLRSQHRCHTSPARTSRRGWPARSTAVPRVVRSRPCSKTWSVTDPRTGSFTIEIGSCAAKTSWSVKS
jgi:hypothetical protein